MAEVAIMANFLNAFADLPKNQQKKVREFTEKFRRDPLHPSINYETLQMRDPKVRSARIDQTYRAIIVHPPAQDVFLLVWVDHHDEAYRWAKNRVFEVNPQNGALQVYQCEEVSAPKAIVPSSTPNSPRGLFSDFLDHDLDQIGVPAALLPSVRSLLDERALDLLVPHLPRQAADGLQMLAAGYSLDSVLEELTRPVPDDNVSPIETEPIIQPDDFHAALKHPLTQAQFCLVSSDEDLADVLNAPLEQWRLFLHPTQRRLVQQSFHGPARVLGGAGTGKTVVLLHRAAHLARNVFKEPGQRILVTTYTRNLAADLRTNLTKLCPEAMSRLEVNNLHSWAFQYLATQGVRIKVASDVDLKNCWQGAISLDTQGFNLNFYRSEWNHVVQAHDVLTRDDYFAAPRRGRGTRLSRPQKVEIWKIFEEYRARLTEMNKFEFADAVREARLHLQQSGSPPPYKAVLADEVQDFRVADLHLLRSLVAPGDNDLFVVGDAHQRIYGHKAALGKAGVHIRGRSRHLRINYRTTQEIRQWAVALLEGQSIDDLDNGSDSLKGYRSLRNGLPPDVHLFDDLGQEIEFLRAQIGHWLSQGLQLEDICVSSPTSGQIQEYSKQLEFPNSILQPDAEAGPGLRLATMHRMKGLEFRAVILAGVQEGTMPSPWGDFADAAGEEDHLLGQRCLLYVAATRARDTLVVTGSGRRCPLFE